jgi:hypothetical protein
MIGVVFLLPIQQSRIPPESEKFDVHIQNLSQKVQNQNLVSIHSKDPLSLIFAVSGS